MHTKTLLLASVFSAALAAAARAGTALWVGDADANWARSTIGAKPS